MSFLYDTVKTIVFYLILVAIVMNLLGTSSYKKYVAMFTGMLLIYIMISPLMKVFNLATTMDYRTNEIYYKTDVKEFSMDISEGEEEQRKYILEEYKKKITDQISLHVVGKNLSIVQCNIEIQEDQSQSDYGTVTNVNLKLREIREGQMDREESLIEKIVIDPIIIEENSSQSDSEQISLPSVKEIELQKELAIIYQIDQDAVQVVIG